MGSAFSSPDAGLPINYTHAARLCQGKLRLHSGAVRGPKPDRCLPKGPRIRTTGGFDTPTVAEGPRPEPRPSREHKHDRREKGDS